MIATVEVVFQRSPHPEMCGTWLVTDCPYCHRQHAHIASNERASEPGIRIAHCTREATSPSYYRLRRQEPRQPALRPLDDLTEGDAQ